MAPVESGRGNDLFCHVLVVETVQPPIVTKLSPDQRCPPCAQSDLITTVNPAPHESIWRNPTHGHGDFPDPGLVDGSELRVC